MNFLLDLGLLNIEIMDLITLTVFIFFMGYLGIVFEHNVKVDKLIPALFMMVGTWTVIALGHIEVFEVNTLMQKLVPKEMEEVLLHHLGKTAEILFFLMGAMTIVEMIDYFDGFASIKNHIKANSKRKLLWIFCILAFVLSAIIDNLTATIVLISILRKMINDGKTRIWFAGLIIIAANAGGAWSPIGDVTTTMLWIDGKVTAGALAKYLFLPSLVCMIVPTLIASYLPAFKGAIEKPVNDENTTNNIGTKMFYIGLLGILFVPIFKIITHLPPYVGMMFSLSSVAVFAEYYSRRKFQFATHKTESTKHHGPLHKALSNIEMPSILFFLGILLAVAALESIGVLFHFAENLNQVIPNKDLVIMFFGVSSAIIDNVPLVAASMGMFSEVLNNPIWHFIAFSAGTGGSMLIIGSAAGVVAMGMEKINFMWYLKKIAWLAVIGFIMGSISFMIIRNLY